MATTAKKKSTNKKKSDKQNDKKPRGAKKQTRAAKNGKKSKKTAKAPATNGKGADERPALSVGQAAQQKDKRQLVQERKILRSQSRWLQKALFALSKAEDDQEKLAEVRGEKHEPMPVTVSGKTHDLGVVTDSLRDSVMERLEALRVTLRNEHALMG